MPKPLMITSHIIARKTNPAFVSVGFKNWKKAIERFNCHQRSERHKHAVTTLLRKAHDCNTITCTKETAGRGQRKALEDCRWCLIFGWENEALRGHENDED